MVGDKRLSKDWDGWCTQESEFHLEAWRYHSFGVYVDGPTALCELVRKIKLIQFLNF